MALPILSSGILMQHLELSLECMHAILGTLAKEIFTVPVMTAVVLFFSH